MPNMISPQVGYNTNVTYRGQSYHIQTEDSGLNHPHVITHVFADGGRIIASTRTSYAEHRAMANLPVIVSQIMKEQHKSVLIALKNGEYDAQLGLPKRAQAKAAEPAKPRQRESSTANPLTDKSLREVVMLLLDRDQDETM